MEGTNNNLSSSGVTVVGSDAPSDYHVAPRTTSENRPPQVTGSTQLPQVTPQPVSAPPPPSMSADVMGGATTLKKKRGRPRKYGPDGSVATVLSPKPISSAAPPPPVIDFSAGGEKTRGKFRSVNSATKLQPLGLEAESSSPRAICILSANGVISSVTLRQHDSSGGTLTYEGRFEILSLTGSFMPSESGGMRNRSGGMSVSLASPDGRVVGGGVAGLLVAAGPVQIVVGSFLAGNQHEQNPKKQKHEMSIIPMSSVGADDAYHHLSSFHGDSWSSMPQDTTRYDNNKPTDINVTLPGQ